MTDLLDASNLTKLYGDVAAVDDISFTVRPGEIVGFLGPNGAGKTTTLKMLTGLLRPDPGTVVIDGHDMEQDPMAAKAVIGYVPDTPNLYGKLKATEYLRFMGQLYRVPGDAAERRIKRLLDLFDLTDSAGNYLEGFSHGMQQKTAIAGALIHNPRIIFMDEPTVGLDPRSARLIKDIMVQQRDRGNAVFFSTHILEIAENMCDRAIIINKGKIIADAPVTELTGMRGTDDSLEDIFLEMTGGRDVDDLVKELANDVS
ncbi:MAG: ABC transporter ATP-binding protein [Chloroflexota bacterium]|nr:ABC transporter ATP-binding protein [Chloroflexota bacterium]